MQDLNLCQHQFYQIIIKVLHYNPSESSTDGGLKFSRLIFPCWSCVTGKTACINTVHDTLGLKYKAVVATTVKATTFIGGRTVFNNNSGLDLPTEMFLATFNSQQLRVIKNNKEIQF